jgi:UDP-3-O-[3-hydroxymyristoyl] N-acetylglucosamine deacetylase
MIRYQRTIKDNITFMGIGLHSGKSATMTLRPAPVDTGIIFVRTDLGGASIEAASFNTAATTYATTLQRDSASVQTVEHLLGALAGLGITNAFVDLNGAEVPILDGSAGPFIRKIVETGLRTQEKVQPVLKVTRPVSVRDGGRQLAIWPANTTSISYFIDFDHPLVREQSITYDASEESFIREIADARTFGFLRDVETMQAKGLAKGGSLENAVMLGPDRVLNKDGLRYHDEFVRHKVLDIIGDLALVGMPVIGHVVAIKAGHALNAQMVARLLQSPLNWVLVGDPERASSRREQVVYQEQAAF